jgi:hypothetical protein
LSRGGRRPAEECRARGASGNHSSKPRRGPGACRCPLGAVLLCGCYWRREVGSRSEAASPQEGRSGGGAGGGPAHEGQGAANQDGVDGKDADLRAFRH